MRPPDRGAAAAPENPDDGCLSDPVCRGHYVFGPGDPKSASPVDMPNRCAPASAQN